MLQRSTVATAHTQKWTPQHSTDKHYSSIVSPRSAIRLVSWNIIRGGTVVAQVVLMNVLEQVLVLAAAVVLVLAAAVVLVLAAAGAVGCSCE